MKHIVYIVTAQSKCIEVWELLNTGEMNLIQIVTTCNGEGQPLVILKKRKKLYVGIRPVYKIIVYDIMDSGKLKNIGFINIPHSPNYLSSDTKEEFLFCSYYHAGCMSISYIDSKHIPGVPIKMINNLKGCHSANIDIYNNIILLPSLLEDRIYCYNFKNFKKKKNFFWEPLYYVNCKKKSGPRHMIFHPNKNYAYSINELNGTVDVWKINHMTQKIQNIQNSNISLLKNKKNFWCADIQITTCGKYLYVSDRLHNIITLFLIHVNGMIDFIKNFDTTLEPKSFIIDNTNKYLISVGQRSNTMIVYNISMNTGYLNKLYEYSTGKNPTWISSYTL